MSKRPAGWSDDKVDRMEEFGPCLNDCGNPKAEGSDLCEGCQEMETCHECGELARESELVMDYVPSLGYKRAHPECKRAAGDA